MGGLLRAATPASPVEGDQARGRSDRLIELLDPREDFNFRHFRMRHMVAELLRPGLPPGSEAPDFELPSTDGNRLRLNDLRGQPVLLHFISYTCPVTRGGVSTMSELYRLYGERVQFVEMLVRQAHPGELHGAYRLTRRRAESRRCLRSAGRRRPRCGSASGRGGRRAHDRDVAIAIAELFVFRRPRRSSRDSPLLIVSSSSGRAGQPGGPAPRLP